MSAKKARKPGDDIARITLARPDKANALDPETIHGLGDAFAQIENSRARVVAIVGEGDDFCAGADIEWLLGTKDQDDADFRSDAQSLANLLLRIRKLPQPVIALAKGACYGGGAGLCCAADICLASTDAEFRFSEVRLGLIAATIGPHVVSAIGERNARRYLLSAEKIDSDEARRMGIVHEVVDPGDLTERADEIIAEILKNAPEAVAHTKRMIFDATGKKITQATANNSADLLTSLRNTPEAIEGLESFMQDRHPSWSK